MKEVELKEVDNRSSEEIQDNIKKIDRIIATNEGKSVVCEVCERNFLPSEVKSTDDYDRVCPECFDTEECEYCSKRFPKEQIHELVCLDGTVSCEHICDDCEEIARSEADASATVYYSDEDYPYRITDFEDDTDGDFSVVYHRTDGWRGYYEVVPSDDWVRVHNDCILDYSYDAEQLKKFDEEFQNILVERGIRYARAFGLTSNVFSTNYDFFVEKGKELEAIAIRSILALKYRDPDRFRKTSLTGKDPSEWSEKDEVFVKAVDYLEEGLKPEDAVIKAINESNKSKCVQ